MKLLSYVYSDGSKICDLNKENSWTNVNCNLRGGGKFNAFSIYTSNHSTYFYSNNIIELFSKPEFTMMFWGKYSGTGPYASAIIGHNITKSGQSNWKGFCLFSRYGSDDNRVVLSYNHSSNSCFAGSNSIILTNNWIHFCITKTSDNIFSLYLNGTKRCSTNCSSPYDDIIYYNLLLTSDAWRYRYIVGYIDDLLMCDKALYTSNFAVPTISNLDVFNNKLAKIAYTNEDNLYGIN